MTDDQDVELGSLKYMPSLMSMVGEQGAILSNAYCSTPICCPSRSSMLTGLYIHNHEVYTNNHNCSSYYWQQTHERKTFATYLKDAGYMTGYFGKYLNKYNGSHIPAGWEDWMGLIKNSRYYNYTVMHNGQHVKYNDQYPKDYFPHVITSEGIQFLKKNLGRDESAPVLLVLSYPAPHGPEDSAPEHAHKFFNISDHITVSYNYAPNPDKQWLLQFIGRMHDIEIKFTDVLMTKRLQTLQTIDESVAKLVNTLDSLRELDNTYIFYTSDHGYHLGQFGLVKGKSMPFEFDIKVPFLVRGPGIKPDSKIDNIALNIDLAPTFLDIAGVELPPHMDGRSLLPYLVNKTDLPPWRTSFLVESSGRHREEDALEVRKQRRQDRARGLAVPPSQAPGLYTSKREHLEVICQSDQYKAPCSPGQKWECVWDMTRWRLHKCRRPERKVVQGRVRSRKRNCVCQPNQGMGYLVKLDPAERRKQRSFLKKYVTKDLKSLRTKFIRVFNDVDSSELFGTSRRYSHPRNQYSRKRRSVRSGPAERQEEGFPDYEDRGEDDVDAFVKDEEIRDLEVTIDNLSDELESLESVSNSSGHNNSEMVATTAEGDGSQAGCRVRGSAVNCTEDVYHDPHAWRMSKVAIDHEIRLLRHQLIVMKDIRKHLRETRPNSVPDSEDYDDYEDQEEAEEGEQVEAGGSGTQIEAGERAIVWTEPGVEVRKEVGAGIQSLFEEPPLTPSQVPNHTMPHLEEMGTGIRERAGAERETGIKEGAGAETGTETLIETGVGTKRGSGTQIETEKRGGARVRVGSGVGVRNEAGVGMQSHFEKPHLTSSQVLNHTMPQQEETHVNENREPKEEGVDEVYISPEGDINNNNEDHDGTIIIGTDYDVGGGEKKRPVSGVEVGPDDAPQSDRGGHSKRLWMSGQDRDNIHLLPHLSSHIYHRPHPSQSFLDNDSSSMPCLCNPNKRLEYKQAQRDRKREDRRRLRLERRRIKQKRREMKERKKLRKIKNNLAKCNHTMLNCYTHDNDHWRTPPLWHDGKFCFCMNAVNNTYWCVRTINQTHNFLYCEFITGLVTYYDLNIDPYQLRNVAFTLSNQRLAELHHRLEGLRTCSGATQCDNIVLKQEDEKEIAYGVKNEGVSAGETNGRNEGDMEGQMSSIDRGWTVRRNRGREEDPVEARRENIDNDRNNGQVEAREDGSVHDARGGIIRGYGGERRGYTWNENWSERSGRHNTESEVRRNDKNKGWRERESQTSEENRSRAQDGHRDQVSGERRSEEKIKTMDESQRNGWDNKRTNIRTEGWGSGVSNTVSPDGGGVAAGGDTLVHRQERRRLREERHRQRDERRKLRKEQKWKRNQVYEAGGWGDMWTGWEEQRARVTRRSRVQQQQQNRERQRRREKKERRRELRKERKRRKNSRLGKNSYSN